MTIWIEFSPEIEDAARASYNAAEIPAEGGVFEIMQAFPISDHTGTRLIIGSSRIAFETAEAIAAAVHGVIVHTEFPEDW